MNTKTCSTCRHWDSLDSHGVDFASGYFIDPSRYMYHYHKRCMAALEHDSDDTEQVTQPIITAKMNGITDIESALFTLPTHSCACWENDDE